MSVTQVPLQPIARGSLTKLWLGIAALIALAFALAWAGTKSFRPEVLASGVEIRTRGAGEGDPIQMADAALVDYEGRTLDGKVFDTTKGRQPAPLTPTGIIPGLGEAMTKMKKGGDYTVRVPAKLAYGATPPPGSGIAPNSDLIFDVKVIEIARNYALMQQMQQMQAQQGGGAPGEAPAGEAPTAPPQPGQ
jgi:FKBP-type peptidyl-prolyl cis-trans isomerase FkpA